MCNEVLKWLHVHKSSKKGRMKIIHHNACNSCGASSTMKHEGCHLRLFLKSFVFKGVNHSTKPLHVWWLVMIHATDTPMGCASNTINVNKWNFTSLVPKVASIELPHYHLMKLWITTKIGFISLL
jgi:hypothetical protein